MSEKPNCPVCSGAKLAVVPSRPHANLQRVECDCGVAGPWGKMPEGAWAQWDVLCAIAIDGDMLFKRPDDPAADAPPAPESPRRRSVKNG